MAAFPSSSSTSFSNHQVINAGMGAASASSRLKHLYHPLGGQNRSMTMMAAPAAAGNNPLQPPRSASVFSLPPLVGDHSSAYTLRQSTDDDSEFESQNQDRQPFAPPLTSAFFRASSTVHSAFTQQQNTNMPQMSIAPTASSQNQQPSAQFLPTGPQASQQSEDSTMRHSSQPSDFNSSQSILDVERAFRLERKLDELIRMHQETRERLDGLANKVMKMSATQDKPDVTEQPEAKSHAKKTMPVQSTKINQAPTKKSSNCSKKNSMTTKPPPAKDKRSQASKTINSNQRSVTDQRSVRESQPSEEPPSTQPSVVRLIIPRPTPRPKRSARSSHRNTVLTEAKSNQMEERNGPEEDEDLLFSLYPISAEDLFERARIARQERIIAKRTMTQTCIQTQCESHTEDTFTFQGPNRVLTRAMTRAFGVNTLYEMGSTTDVMGNDDPQRIQGNDAKMIQNANVEIISIISDDSRKSDDILAAGD